MVQDFIRNYHLKPIFEEAVPWRSQGHVSRASSDWSGDKNSVEILRSSDSFRPVGWCGVCWFVVNACKVGHLSIWGRYVVAVFFECDFQHPTGAWEKCNHPAAVRKGWCNFFGLETDHLTIIHFCRESKMWATCRPLWPKSIGSTAELPRGELEVLAEPSRPDQQRSSQLLQSWRSHQFQGLAITTFSSLVAAVIP